jgi:hypothetical protein
MYFSTTLQFIDKNFYIFYNKSSISWEIAPCNPFK